jgi:1-deoxy-D-xylulose-5-phosphate synthase
VAERFEKEGISIGVYDMRFVKPLDEKLLHQIFKSYDNVITIEDGCVVGGFGSAVLEFMADNQYTSVIKRLGIPDRIVEHGEQADLHTECGYDPDALFMEASKLLETEKVY